MFQFFIISFINRPGILIGGLGLVAVVCWLLRKAIVTHTLPGNQEAEAIVLSIGKTGLYINDQPQLKLQMQVQPEKGRSFVTEINEIFPAATVEKLRTGTKIKVRYSTGRSKHIIVLN
jgi:hypothetical protein